MTVSSPGPQGQEHVPLVPVDAPPLTPLQRLRRLIFGSPISTEHSEHSLLPKFLALPVFASDAISSVAYATQQILLVLGTAGLAALDTASKLAYERITLLITGLIVALLAIVITSYWQTIHGYPGGGGSYIVSRE